MTLDEILNDPEAKARFIEGGVRVIEEEVAGKSGLSGRLLKGAFATVKALRPGILASLLNMLLPHFAPAVSPHFEKAKAQGDVQGYFAANASTIAEAMLAITDEAAGNAQNKVLKKTYRALRGQASKHTTEAMPAVGRLLQQFAN